MIDRQLRALSQVQVNDRVILPPFGHEVNYDFHNSRRCEARRVLSIARHGDVVTLQLDGDEPRTLPADLLVQVKT